MENGTLGYLDFFTAMLAVVFGALGVGKINTDAADIGESDMAAAKIFRLAGRLRVVLRVFDVPAGLILYCLPYFLRFLVVVHGTVRFVTPVHVDDQRRKTRSGHHRANF